jgi:hypothetical protein
MKTATFTDTFDHMLGSGALQFSWWRGCKVTGAPNGEPTEAWSAELTAEDGAREHTATINHAAVMRAARAIMAGKGGEYVSDATKRECKALVFDADDCDFDAATADEVLQVIVLGEVVFG